MISILALQNLENSCKTTPPLPRLLTLTGESQGWGAHKGSWIGINVGTENPIALKG